MLNQSISNDKLLIEEISLLFLHYLTKYKLCYIINERVLHIDGKAVSPVRREVIAMVNYSDLFLLVSILTEVVALCYFIFHKK